MLDNKEIIARVISSKNYWVRAVEYAVTCNVVARELALTADEAFAGNGEVDAAGAALQDLYLEANNRYRKDMNEVLDSIMEKHGDTLKVLGITRDMVHDALKSYAEEVFGEISERLKR